MATAEVQPTEHFAKRPQYEQVKISPNGEYLAVTTPVEDSTSLIVISLDTREVTAALRFGAAEHVNNFWWVGPERLVASRARSGGSLAGKRRTGELIGTDADGDRQSYLFGYRGEDSVGSHLKDHARVRGSATIIDPMADDPSRALIAIDYFESGADRSFSPIELMHVVSGRRGRLTKAPLNGSPQYAASPDAGQLVLVGSDASLRPEIHTWERDREQWTREPLGAAERVRAVGFSRDGERAYVLASHDQGPLCLKAVDIGTGTRSTLYCHPSLDIADVVFSFDGNTPVAAVVEGTTPRHVILAPKHPDAIALQKIANSFPDQHVMPVSSSRDGDKVVFRVTSDRNPGDYYLFNTKTEQAEYLLSNRPWIDPETMAPRSGFAFEARDGRTVHGILTTPPGADSRPLPLVVMPHGGPFGIRDTWQWDADAQFLANRGFAVAQINFRGSSGFGTAFYNAGRGAWGTGMIDDLADGVAHLADQGTIDADRVCIAGASYGGYAALMYGVRYPDDVQCVSTYVGVSDLPHFADSTDVRESARGSAYLSHWVGDESTLASQSPLALIDRLDAPVFITHGGQDRRVPISQAKRLRDALEARNHPFEWMTRMAEGHGFYSLDSRTEYLDRLAAFVNKHLAPD